MINNTKILTVSYGTFSCTLEGFDDSFGTMKAIAEYFRDLAADDRYFGAEPAQPDAQMLARIAQREISRHVDAREDDGRIVLSARNTSHSAALVARDAVEDVATAVAAATEASTAALDSGDVEDAEESLDLDAEAVAPKASITAEAPQSVEAPRRTAPAAPKAPKRILKVSAPVILETGKAARAVEVTAKAAAQDIVPSLPDAEVEAFFADAQATDATSDVFEDDTQDTPAQERMRADSIADKLKRIRAVVSQQSAQPAPSDYSEDQHAEAAAPQPAAARAVAESDAHDFEDDLEDIFEDEEALDAPAQGDVLARTLRDLEEALDADDENEHGTARARPVERDDESEDDDISAILSRLEREAVEDVPAPQARAVQSLAAIDPKFDDFEDDGFDGSFDDDAQSDSNILSAIEETDVSEDGTAAIDSDADEGNNLFDKADEEPAPEEIVAEEINEAVAAPQDVAPAPVAPPQATAAPRTRVLKVKRATLEAAIQSGQLEEYEDDEDEDDRVEATCASLRNASLAKRSSLSDEAEEDLARELAELEADMAAQRSAAAAQKPPAEAQPVAEHEPREATPARAEIKGEAEDNLSRLMDESDHQMEEPESATRRDAFAHLRAAVAAKKADEAVGGTSEAAESDVAYRDDLANVVRPRRPASGERPRTERPQEQRPAPLKLVAEQRIDLAQARTVTPVRPRRVAVVEAAPELDESQHEASNFSEFAAEMGAHKLPDLLEAAAAYLSFVEGHAEFSRPQLMNKVRQVEQENFTREDSLRSFGKLLREGKIEKLEGGRFQASDQIGFKPDARAAG